jgi:hypothetical protein
LIQQRLQVAVPLTRSLGQRAVSLSERRQDFAGVAQVEEIDNGNVLIGDLCSCLAQILPGAILSAAGVLFRVKEFKALPPRLDWSVLARRLNM